MPRQLQLSDLNPRTRNLPNKGSVSKVSQYDWGDPGPMGEFQLLHKDSLIVDLEYQRDLVASHTYRIAREFSWDKFAAIVVNRRPDGKYVVIEGQNRVGACKLRDDVTYVPCMVFDMASKVEEAQTFHDINQGRVGLKSVEKWRAQLMMGDVATVMIDSLVREAGMKIGTGSNDIQCVRALVRQYRNGPEAFTRVWPIIIKLCKGDVVREGEVCGITWVERNLPEGVSISDKQWNRKFIPANLATLRQHIADHRRLGGNERAAGEAVLAFINYGLKNRLELRIK